MKQTTLSIFCLWACVLAFVLAPVFTVECAGDQVTNWNRVASDVLLSNTSLQNPGFASRTMAMVNLAMYDSINNIAPVNQPFYSHAAAGAGADMQAAAAQAARDVLFSIYPAEQTLLDNELTTALSGIPNGTAKTAGMNYGSLVASNVINARANDGYNGMVSYSTTSGIGNWQPDPLNPTQVVWGPEWGQVATFGTSSSNQFMPSVMPAITSQDYTDAYNEVKDLGALNSPNRTADQTEAAYFWAYDRTGMGTPMRMYNSILRTVANQEGNTLHENAHLFALATTSVADAGITAWDAKFLYDFWRPVTGIRDGDIDGNPNTAGDPNWIPLGAPGDGAGIDDFTPPFPTYISGHATFGGALFASIENFYGTDAIAFSLTSEEMPGVTRSFNSLSEAMAENGRSRVYLGIHWDFDDLVGRETGTQIADHLNENYFAVVPEPSFWVLGLPVVFLILRGRKKVGSRR